MKNYSNIILKYLKAHPQTRFKIKQFATILKIPENEYPFFRDSVKNLVREGKLYRFKGNSYGLMDQKGELYGILDMHPNGFAFVHTEAGDKIFISQENLATACHGDNVGVLIHSKKSSSKNKEGHVSKIISRSKDKFVCTYHKLHSYSLAIPAIHHLQTEIVIENCNGLAPAEGDYIMARITEWRKGGNRHKGEILSIIGKEHVAEFDAIIVFQMQP
jgi:ribonuclease R